MKLPIAALILGLTAPAVMAEGTATSVIVALTVRATGVYVVKVSSPVSGSPSCAKHTDEFALVASTETGRTQAAALLSAFSLQVPVEFHGSNECLPGSDAETLSYFVLRHEPPRPIVN